jgi:hypothetical protein
MTPLRTVIILLILGYILYTAGCTMPFTADYQTPGLSNASVAASVAKYQLTLAQPEDSSTLIKMDTDVYNLGEVVEFIVTNEKNQDLSCSTDPPSFSVRYQKGTGQWVTRMGEENPAPGNTTKLKPGESTAPYRFVTAGWSPGRYRIVSTCGVSREILLRALPSVTEAGPSCLAGVNTTPYIQVTAVSDQNAGDTFVISGTTNLAAGEELRYSIFAVSSATPNISAAKLISSSITVSGGSCGTNTWSVYGEIQVPGDYFIGISNSANTVSAIRRFSVLPKARSTVTTTLPVKTNAPGITTG